MMREFRVDANVGRPQVAYRETISRAGQGRRPLRPPDRRHGPVRPRGLKLEPQEKGAGYEFVDKIVGGAVPREYIQSVDAGHPRGHGDGRLRRLPGRRRQGRRCIDGSYHEVDSSEMAFKIAGSMAVKDAFAKADPAILEPIMKVEVTCPRSSWATSSAISTVAAGRSRAWSRAGDAGRPGVRAAGPDVRLRDRPAVDDPGPRHVTRWNSIITPRSRPTWPRNSSRSRRSSRSTAPSEERETHDGQEEVRAHQAARQRRHDRARRPRQDDA